MLNDRVYQLLTSAVDGELSSREKREIQKLLHESEEVRRTYERLKSDAQRLQNLPRQRLPANFASRILQKISPIYRHEPSRNGDGASRRLPAWANLAAAAVVLLAISMGTFLVLMLTDREREIVNRNPVPPVLKPPSAHEPPRAIAKNNSSADKSTEPERSPQPPIELIQIPKPETPKAVDPGTHDALTSPPQPSFDRLWVVEPKLTPILSVRDLDKNGSRQQLAESLKKNPAVHLDLFCRDTNRAFERLQAAFGGTRLLVDAVAQERLSRKLKTHYVFYSETLSADEIQQVLVALAADERKAEVKREGQFDKLVINPLSAESHRTLSTLLGVDPKWLQSKAKASAPADPTKPLTDSTAESLSKALKNGPSNARSERLVLVLPYNPIRPNPLASKEVRQFLESVSKERRAGAMSLLLVLRTAE